MLPPLPKSWRKQGFPAPRRSGANFASRCVPRGFAPMLAAPLPKKLAARLFREPFLINLFREQNHAFALRDSICKYFCLKLAERFFRRKKIFAKSPHGICFAKQKKFVNQNKIPRGGLPSAAGPNLCHTWHLLSNKDMNARGR